MNQQLRKVLAIKGGRQPLAWFPLLSEPADADLSLERGLGPQAKGPTSVRGNLSRFFLQRTGGHLAVTAMGVGTPTHLEDCWTLALS